MKTIKFLFMAFVVGLVVFSFSLSVEATVTRGYAPIINGDTVSAKAEARRQALREIVEKVVGVHVQSTTEVANFAIVADQILTKSDGYVLINKIIKDEPRGEVWYVELDVNVNADKIRTTSQDLKSLLDNNVNESNSRGGIQVAVVRRNLNGSFSYDEETKIYLTAKLKEIGLNPIGNDEVELYMLNHGNDADVGLQARRIARINRTEENAIMRGVLATESIQKVQGGYKAVVKASFEIIGLDSNSVDAFGKYFSAIGADEKIAVYFAEEKATREAMDSLARQALETVQSYTRGGVTQNFKLNVDFNNVTDFERQTVSIRAALQNARCKVIRMTRVGNSIRAFITADSYETVDEISQAIMNAMPGLKLGEQNSGELGSSKLVFSF